MKLRAVDPKSLALCTLLAVLGGCSAGPDPLIGTDPPPFRPYQIQISPRGLTLGVGDSRCVVGALTRETSLPMSRASWSSSQPDVVGVSTAAAAVQGAGSCPSAVGFFAAIQCARAGSSVLSVTAIAESGDTANDSTTVTCTSTTAISPTSLVGTYTKSGTRTGGTCNPAVFGESFQATLVVESSSGGSGGIRLLENHPGDVQLPYSELTFTSIPGGLRIVTGTPTRTINGRSYQTHLEIDVVDGRVTGTETFRDAASGCTDVYAISGQLR